MSGGCAANWKRLMWEAFILGFQLNLIKSDAGKKIIDLPQDTPSSFLMIDASLPFIHSPSLLAGPKRIRDKNRSMCKCLLWSIYQGVMVFGT